MFCVPLDALTTGTQCDAGSSVVVQTQIYLWIDSAFVYPGEVELNMFAGVVFSHLDTYPLIATVHWSS